MLLHSSQRKTSRPAHPANKMGHQAWSLFVLARYPTELGVGTQPYCLQTRIPTPSPNLPWLCIFSCWWIRPRCYLMFSVLMANTFPYSHNWAQSFVHAPIMTALLHLTLIRCFKLYCTILGSLQCEVSVGTVGLNVSSSMVHFTRDIFVRCSCYSNNSLVFTKGYVFFHKINLIPTCTPRFHIPWCAPVLLQE